MLLEPVMEVEVVTPQEFMGEVIGDLNSRRGKILDMESRAGAQVIEARVPLADDVRLRDAAALDHAGPRQLHDAVRRLRTGAADRFSRS